MQSTQESAASRGSRRPPVLTLAVYGGAVVLLLMAAFFARGFSRDVGDGRVAGRYSLFPLLGSHAPEELTLTWNGLALHFTRAMTPALQGVEAAEGSTDLVFDGDIRLRLTPGTDTGGSITLASVNSSGSASIHPLVVPYSVAGILGDPPSDAALSWKRAGRTFLLTLPPGARADPSTGTVTLPARHFCMGCRPARPGGERCCTGHDREEDRLFEPLARGDGNADQGETAGGTRRLHGRGVQGVE